MDTRKLILLVPRSKASLAARTFYVDTVSGNDDNDGLTLATAWQTKTKVNAQMASFRGDDNIYFKRGQTHPGRILPTWHGSSADHPINFGSYGLGPNAIIDGSASSALYIPITATNAYFLRFENLDFSGATGAQMSVVRVFTSYVHFQDCEIHGSASWHGMDASSIGGAAIHHITLNGCHIHDNGDCGVYIGVSSNEGPAYGPHDCSITDCEVDHNGLTNPQAHGIYVRHGVNVLRNNCHDNAYAGIKTNGEDDQTYAQVPTVAYNYCNANYTGIVLAQFRTNCHDNKLWDNHDENVMFEDSVDDCLMYFNTLVNAHGGQGLLFVGSAQTGNNIRNNLIIQDSAVNPGRPLIVTNGADITAIAANNTFDYNRYYYSASASAQTFQQTGGTPAYKTFAEWKALTGSPDAHSNLLTDLPGFVARYTDLRPSDTTLTGQSLAGGGLAISGYETDFNGVMRTDPPTPGCYDEIQPEPVHFASAEVGLVGPTKVRVTFDTNILAASDYKAGSTIKVNGSAATISTAARQADTKIIEFVLSAEVSEGDTVTWEYDADTGELTNGQGTFNLADVAAQTVTNNVVNTLINVTYEAGNLNEHSSTSTSGGAAIAAAAEAALNGTNYGAKITLAVNAANQKAFGINTLGTASQTGVVLGGEYFDPNSMTMVNGDSFILFSFFSGGNEVGGVKIYYWNEFILMGYIVDDNSVSTNTSQVAITDGPHTFEVKLTRATNAGSADGRLDFWVDGANQKTITGKDNYDMFANFSKLEVGARSGVDAGTNGSFYQDEIEVNNNGNRIFA